MIIQQLLKIQGLSLQVIQQISEKTTGENVETDRSPDLRKWRGAPVGCITPLAKCDKTTERKALMSFKHVNCAESPFEAEA